MFGNAKSGPPPKLGVTIAVGSKPKMGGKEDAPPMMMRGKMAEHEEPDADQMGGASDGDADNRIAENVEMVLNTMPELAHPIGALFEALAKYCQKQGGEEAGEGEAGY